MGDQYAGEKVEPLAADVANVRFDERGLVPAVVQQAGTGEVLMVAWMSAESLALTLETGTTWFWSRSRSELWNKGATSGNMQQVRRVLVDCDADTLLVEVDSPGPACHTGHRSCFFRELVGNTDEKDGE
ncbi:phosphoribosyl-AMP cyclohydrolase [Olsenella uli]|uniref:phosphoribosyl-AMP cyclohydrolase n=1 Tax=Olsenella uli TaxID=133926 RepID=UPI00195AE53E|nr:phosphoribosyl-AMP cyclohydrolase [Olsenella uli]MBM6675427.1 phosphoribosyl-AMP cyclohydrolase [Olsenella uli]